MLGWAYLVQRGNALPNHLEWQRLILFSVLNTALYLGLFVLALRQVSAGIGSLSTATNPLFISLISAVWLRRPVRWQEGMGLVLGLLGVSVATLPLLDQAYATPEGLLILLGSMLSVSVATVYYARFEWRLPKLVINGWQVFIAGFVLLPFTLLTTNVAALRLDATFWYSVFWLVIPVSVISLQLWFGLVQADAVRASLWLFLCPVFGFTYSAMLTAEPITIYTIAGTVLVISGLWLGRK
jgi:probable blue pigment (indigoidine) exporter